jgi:hypothetical protein
MKKITTLLFVILGMTMGFAQQNSTKEYPGDNFSLEGALALFKKSRTLEEFERALNEENNNVNNLDLNNDGKIDYINVDDIKQNDTHVIVLSTYLNETERQDIATITVEKTGNEAAVCQITGDEDLYPPNTVIEPSVTADNSGNSVNASTENSNITVNLWFWPSVGFLFGPDYFPYVSRHRWGFYPRWWIPWHPYSHAVFYNRYASYRNEFRRTSTPRITAGRSYYAPRRLRSNMVFGNHRGNAVMHNNNHGGRGNGARGGGRGHGGRGRR